MHDEATTQVPVKIENFSFFGFSIMAPVRHSHCTAYFRRRQPRNPFFPPSSCPPAAPPVDIARGRCASISGSPRCTSLKHLAQNNSGSSCPFSASHCPHRKAAFSEHMQHHEDDACSSRLCCCCWCLFPAFPDSDGVFPPPGPLRSNRASSIAC